VTRPTRRLAPYGICRAVLGRAVLGCVAFGCVAFGWAVLAGCGPENASRSIVPPPGIVATRSPPIVTAPSRQVTTAPQPVVPRAAVTSLEIPRVGVSARLVPLRLTRGALGGPEQPHDAGWYAESPLPGDRGAAILVGHVDSRSGPAAFYRLAHLRPGDLVIVRRTDGRVRFRVEDIARYPRTRVPLQAVYGPTPDRALRLITCDGPYRRSTGYRDNVVVYALAE